MPIHLTLRQLEVFVAVATAGQVTRAAAEVGLTQSAASMALADLERQLNVSLFDRAGRHLHLSGCGRQLLPKARDVLDRVREIAAACGPDALPGCFSLRLGASLTIGNHLLPPLVADALRRCPEADIRIAIRNSEQIAADLLAFRIDIGFIEGSAMTGQLVAYPWRSDRLVVFAAPGHPFAGSAPLSRDSLAEAAWVLRERGSGTREIFERAFGGTPRRVLELEQPEAIRQSVRAGAGIGCLSELELADAFRAGWLVPLPCPELELARSLSVVLHQDKYRSRGIREFLAVCGIDGEG